MSVTVTTPPPSPTPATPQLGAAVDALRAWSGRRVLVAMSGGVDSSLAAALLHLAGAEVIGIHMRTWHYKELEQAGPACARERGLATCCSPADARDAQRVGEQFGFACYTIDFQVNFRQAVIEPFIADYLAGRTPNPCINCNNRLKLGSLLAKGRAYGAEAVATGHYAQLALNPATGRHELRAAADPGKDQTYYLYGLTQPQLAHMLLPIGALAKPQVRALARELGLHLSEKPDSYEICFVPDNDYRRFLREDKGLDEAALAGAIVDTAGNVLGRHSGIHGFTIGQRRGIGIAAERPLYVVALLPETKTVVVGHEHELAGSGLELEAINWVAEPPPQGDSPEPIRARVKIRYRHAGSLATIYPEPAPGGAEPARARIVFDEPVRAITPGQAAVAYDAASATRVLLGGTITRRID